MGKNQLQSNAACTDVVTVLADTHRTPEKTELPTPHGAQPSSRPFRKPLTYGLTTNKHVAPRSSGGSCRFSSLSCPTFILSASGFRVPTFCWEPPRPMQEGPTQPQAVGTRPSSGPSEHIIVTHTWEGPRNHAACCCSERRSTSGC